MGLALDIVPDFARGGSWRLITKLAKWAEPHQNQPRAPFRWVGYNGDAGHGRGNHLHLSWNHSDTAAGHRAKSVYTMRCPGSNRRRGGKDGGSGGTGGTGGGGGGNHHGGGGRNDSGGIKPGGGSSGGGLSARQARAMYRDAAQPVVETGGVGLDG
jgi:hypothetical protein